MNKREHIRSDERQPSLTQIKKLFDEGVFQDKGDDLFGDEDLQAFVDNVLTGMPTPAFGAKEDEAGDPHFKSGKLRQVVNKCLELAASGELGALNSRKICAVRFKIVSVSEVEFYNPGITQAEIDQALKFYL